MVNADCAIVCDCWSNWRYSLYNRINVALLPFCFAHVSNKGIKCRRARFSVQQKYPLDTIGSTTWLIMWALGCLSKRLMALPNGCNTINGFVASYHPFYMHILASFKYPACRSQESLAEPANLTSASFTVGTSTRASLFASIIESQCWKIVAGSLMGLVPPLLFSDRDMVNWRSVV